MLYLGTALGHSATVSDVLLALIIGITLGVAGALCL